jgi:hypothetical protein
MSDTRINLYGAQHTGEFVGAEYHASVESGPSWSARDLQRAGGRITRLRLLSDPGFPLWDVSYCHGTLPDGRIVPVDIGTNQFPKRDAVRHLCAVAKAEGYYAKGIGLLDRGNWSTLQ